MSLDQTFTRQHVLSKKGPVDGDGDGFVYDGTPRKRPATPAEMAAGARLRAKQGQKAVPARAGAKKAPAARAGRKAPAKNDYDKRVDKFERAVDQAIRSKDKKQIKQVEGLINGDLILKNPDKQDLKNLLVARRDGLDDPKPVAGGNRAKRLPAGAAPAKKAAAKAPAKKAPAKKAPAKPAPKAESKTERNGVPVGRKTADSLDRLDAADKAKAKKPGAIKQAAAKTPEFNLPGPKTIAGEFHEKIKAAKTEAELDEVYRKVSEDKRMPEVWKRALRQDVMNRRKEIKDAKKTPSPAERIAPHTGGARVPKPSPNNALRERMAAAAEAKRQQSFERRSAKKVAAKNPTTRVTGQTAAERARDADNAKREAGRQQLEREQAAAAQRRADRAAKKAVAAPRGPGRQPTIESVETTHGPKTRAWMRHAEKDIKNARDFRTLKGRVTQISNLRAAGRISDREALRLRQMVYDRLDELGLDRNGNRKQPTWRQRVASFGSRNAKPDSKGPETKAYSALRRAKNTTSAERAVQGAQSAARRGEVSPSRAAGVAREGFRVKRRIRDQKALESANRKADEQRAIEHGARRVIQRVKDAKDQQSLDNVKAELARPVNRNVREHFRANPAKLRELNDAYAKRKAELAAKPKTPPRDTQSARVQAVEQHLKAAGEANGRVAREAAIKRALDMINDDSGMGQETRLELIDRAQAVYNGKPDPGRGRRAPRPANTPPARPSTVEPPSQPGAARQAARDAGLPKANPRVRSYLNQIDAAKDTNDLQSIADALGRGEGNLKADEIDEVFSALDRKHRRLVPLAEDRKGRILGRPNRPVSIPIYTGDVKQSPAGKELAAGAKIEDVKDVEGLYDYIVANSTGPNARFTIKRVSNGQVSQCATVIDHQNGDKKYFFKSTDNNGPAEMWGDGVNEYMAAALGNAAFKDLFPEVQWAGRPEDNKNARIRMEHMDEIAKKIGGNNVRYSGGDARGRLLADPKQALMIHMFDYLINQTDRHSGNYGVIDTPKGQHLVPLDNGAAFHAYDGYINAHYRDRGALAETPEKVGYADWLRWGKATAMMNLASQAYQEKGWGRDKLAADAEDILRKFKAVDIDAIMADMKKRFPNLNDYEDDHLSGADLIWKNRLALLTVDDVVKVLGR